MSRFNGQYHTRKIPKRSRTIPIYGSSVRGDGQDAGKYYQCWNCGFICNKDRDALGDSETGIVYETYVPLGESGLIESVMGGDLSSFVSEHLDSDGNVQQNMDHYRTATTRGGCPFCGCMNYRGDNP